MKIGSLFAGYGGLTLATEQHYGGKLAWYAEIEAAPSKIMTAHWPNVPNLGDVTKIDWTRVEPVDIIDGGSPCQDLSLAGRRAGMKPGTRSGLWESMREAIAIIKPRYVVWENVKGALSATATSALEQSEGLLGNGHGEPALRALGRVLGDLTDLGYDAAWTTVRAADVGAPHNRARVFLVAEITSSAGSRRRDGTPGQSNPGAAHDQVVSSDCPPVQPRAAQRLLATPNTMDHLPAREGEALEKARARGIPGGHLRAKTGNLREDVHLDFRQYQPAINKWVGVIGEPAPNPVEPDKTGGKQLSARFTEWLMGLPAGWVTGQGLTRTQELTALGNGVVPQQAKYALELIDLMKGNK